MQTVLWVLFSLLLPGTGHYFFGKKKKSFSLLIVIAVIAAVLFLTDSLLTRVLMVFAYFMTAMPAALETFFLASTKENTKSIFTKPYIISIGLF